MKMSTLQRIQPSLHPFYPGSLPEIKSLSLRNNIPVFLIDAGTEDMIRIEFTFKAGMVKEYIPLLAASVNMMLTEGSMNYSAEELNRLIDFYGVFMNPLIDKDRAGIVVYLLNKHLEKVLELCREILFFPSFPEKELVNLMNKRLSRFHVNREKVQVLSLDQFFRSLYGNHHPYGRQIVESDFENITPAILKDFHTKHYTPENMAIIVSGKIPVNIPELLNLFSDKASPGNLYIEETENHILGEKRKKVRINKPGAVQTSIRIGSATINKRDPDYPGLKFLDAILGGYFGSRLMKNIREDKGYTYGIHSALSSLDLCGYKLISTEVGKKYTQKTIDEIRKEIILLQTVPVEKEELDVVRQFLSGEMVRMFDGPFALAESFRSVWEFGLDNTYYIRLAEKIRTIGADEIMWLAQKYYKIDDLYEITAGEK